MIKIFFSWFFLMINLIFSTVLTDISIWFINSIRMIFLMIKNLCKYDQVLQFQMKILMISLHLEWVEALMKMA